MGTSGKEVGGVRAAAGAEVGCHDSNIGAHCGRCAGTFGRVGAGGEGEGEGEGSRDRCGGDGDRGDGGDGEMEVEETLKEKEKLADEAVMEE